MFTPIASHHNPYIIGRPIYEKDLFFGRQELFRFIEDNLNQRVQVILLHGQRRIGKSSVLAQIPNFVQLEQFVFVSLSLEGQSRKSLGDVLSDLAREIIDQLELKPEGLIAPLPTLEKSLFKENPQAFADRFLPAIYQALGDKNLVFLIDEFDVLEDHHPDAASDRFFPFLQSILHRHPKLYLIPVVGRRLDELPNLLNLFGRAPYQEVGLLSGRAAQELIVKPAEAILEYDSEAIAAILSLTAGHPYFTQVLCFAVFAHLREQERHQVTRTDVLACVERAIELGQAGLAWFRDGLPIAERVVFAAVAALSQAERTTAVVEASSGGVAATKPTMPQDEPLALLEKYGVVITEAIRLGEERLLKLNLIQRVDPLSKGLSQSSRAYKVTVELVSQWLLNRYPVQTEIWELENCIPNLQSLYQEAVEKVNRGDREAAIELYNQILVTNPNYFSVLFNLAAEYLNTEEIYEAIRLYKRAYRINPERIKTDYRQTLVRFALSMLLRGKLEQARHYFEQAKWIEHDGAIDTVCRYLVPANLRGATAMRSTANVTTGNIFKVIYRRNAVNTERFLDALNETIELTDELRETIKLQLTVWRKYQERLDEYKLSLIEATYREYPLTVATRIELFNLQRSLKIKDDDAETIRWQLMPEMEVALDEAKEHYREAVETLITRGWISPISRRILNLRRDEYGLIPSEAERIEQELLQPYENHQKNLLEYEAALAQVVELENPLTPETWDELNLLQRLLKLADEDVKPIQARLLKSS